MTSRLQALSVSVAAFITLGASAAWSQEGAGDIADLRVQASDNFGIVPAKPPELSDNPATPPKLELGKMPGSTKKDETKGRCGAQNHKGHASMNACNWE